jgi:hypothetical protein
MSAASKLGRLLLSRSSSLELEANLQKKWCGAGAVEVLPTASFFDAGKVPKSSWDFLKSLKWRQKAKAGKRKFRSCTNE